MRLYFAERKLKYLLSTQVNRSYRDTCELNAINIEDKTFQITLKLKETLPENKGSLVGCKVGQKGGTSLNEQNLTIEKRQDAR